ncbi:hypothetical protein [Arsenophonus endosymbiont of Aleurodicus floccissimus]|uniref:hypothetical protein n=1 Tax=Arsenophonus endosymbiont of Aleurodicus floccissimus TaxID=2152761 RepID=UPI0034E235E8
MSLSQVAREIGAIINSRYDGSNASVLNIQQVLEDYSELIERWAKRVVTKFVETVSQDNAKLWQQTSREMSRELKQLIAQPQWSMSCNPLSMSKSRILNRCRLRPPIGSMIP